MYIFLIVINFFRWNIIKGIQFETTITDLHPSQKQRNLLIIDEMNIDKSSKLITGKLCLGTPHQCLHNIVFDTASVTFLIFEQSSYIITPFIPSNSSSFINTTLKVQQFFTSLKIKGYIAEETLFLSKENITTKNNFPFIISNELEGIFPFNGIIGFGKKFDSRFNHITNISESIASRFLLVKYLYQEKKINKEIFSYHQISNTSGILYLGETGLNKSEYIPKCYSNIQIGEQDKELINFWNCKFYGIYYKNYTRITPLNESNYNNNNYAYNILFDSAANGLVIPSEFFKIIKKDYEDAYRRKCLINIYKHTERLMCDSSFHLEEMPSLVIDLKNFSLEFVPQDVFVLVEQHKGNKFYRFYLRELKESTFIIGSSFFKRYNFIFDYSDGSVGVSINNNINIIEGVEVSLFPFKVKKVSIIFIIIIILCIFGVILTLISKKHIEKEIKSFS